MLKTTVVKATPLFALNLNSWFLRLLQDFFVKNNDCFDNRDSSLRGNLNQNYFLETYPKKKMWIVELKHMRTFWFKGFGEDWTCLQFIAVFFRI